MDGSQKPIYPKYLKGSLQLYFNNKQIIEIKLYSDDLRTKIIFNVMGRRNNHIECNYEYFLLNGRKIINVNKYLKRINKIAIKRSVQYE